MPTDLYHTVNRNLIGRVACLAAVFKNMLKLIHRCVEKNTVICYILFERLVLLK